MVGKERSMQENNDILIDKMIKALDRAALESKKYEDPFAWWPINYSMYTFLFLNDIYGEYFRDFESLKKKYSLREIAALFKYPTAIWLFLVTAVRAMKSLRMPKEKRIKITVDILKMIQFRMSGNIFCENKKNIIWTAKKAQNFVYKTKWVSTRYSKSVDRFFKRLHAALISFDEAVFWNANCATREIHGPYDVVFKGKNAQLLVRNYYNLYAPDLELKLIDFPYESVVTYTLYDTKVKFDFPVLNDFRHDLPLTGHTLAVWGETRKKGKRIFIAKEKILESLCKDIEKKCFEVAIKVESMTRDEHVLESLRRVCYRGKVLKHALNKSWKPEEKLMERVKKDLEGFASPKFTRMTKKQFYTRTDPRIDPQL